MARYAWIIDRDHLAEEFGVYPEVGVKGPSGITDEQQQQLRAGEGHPFRMVDGDQILYYAGRLVGDHDSEDGFGPLQDFGTPNAGCAEIQYQRDGRWVAL